MGSSAVALRPERTDERRASAGDLDARRSGWLQVTAVVLAVLPVITAAVRAARRGWYPTGDDGYAAVRAHDVLTTQTPLLGTWSSASQWTHRLINHPGPAQFDALALPVRLLGPATGVAVGTALINCVCIAGIAWLARRRGGPGLLVAAMVFVATLSWSIGSEVLYDPWSQHAPIFPFALFLFAVWSVADGDLPALPIAVLAGSFALQTHLSYVLLVPGLGIWALVGLVVSVRRRRSEGASAIPRRRWARWVVASVALLLVVWAQPLYEQVIAYPGNLSTLGRSAAAKPPMTPGIRGATEAVGDLIAVPPFWLPPSWGHPPFHPQLSGGGRPVAVVGAAFAVVLGIGAWLTLLALRRRDRAASSALITAGAAIGLAFASTAHSTSPYGLQATYLRWLWPLSMFVWLTIAFGAVRALAAATTKSTARPAAGVLRHRLIPLAGGVAVVALVAGLTLPTVDNGNASSAWGIRVSKQLFRTALPQLRGKGAVWLRLPPTQAAFTMGPAIMAQLQDHGITFKVSDTRQERTLVRQVGHRRTFNGSNAKYVLTVEGGNGAANPLPGVRSIAFSPGLGARDRAEMVRLATVLTARVRSAGGARLSAVGKRLASKKGLPADVARGISRSVAHPDSILRGEVPDKLLTYDLIDLRPLGRDDFVRFVALHRTWESRTAALHLVRVAPGATQR